MAEKATISFAASAVGDLEEIRQWFADQQVPEVGVKMIAEVLRRVERLVVFPNSGRIVPEFATPSLREIIFPPFRIVYRLENDQIRVVRVWRSERLLRPEPQ